MVEEEAKESASDLWRHADDLGWSAKTLAKHHHCSIKEVNERLQMQKAEATVYDAVADGVNGKGQRVRKPNEVWDSENISTPNDRRAPDEVLARRREAHAEGEARIDVMDSDQLPQSDLLQCIHQYASDYYDATEVDGFKFMDETALLAMGVLMEEQMREYLGISR